MTITARCVLPPDHRGVHSYLADAPADPRCPHVVTSHYRRHSTLATVTSTVSACHLTKVPGPP